MDAAPVVTTTPAVIRFSPRRSDVVALGWTLAFVAWVVFDIGGERWAAPVDFVLFGVLGPAVGMLQLRVARRVASARERLAWRLLAAASFSRFLSGSVWGLWVAVTGAAHDPAWLSVLASLYLVFGVAALLTFPGHRWGADDRVRFRLDAGIVLLGSLLVVWFFALGPLVRATDLDAGPGIAERVYTIGDSVTVVLAAALYLRSSLPFMRTAAVLLLCAFTLQVVPDLAFWSGEARAAYRAGDPIALYWYAVWAFKWLAARYADQAVTSDRDLTTPATRYRSGLVPFGFLAVASGVLFFSMAFAAGHDLAIYALGCALLAGLLVARQAVELRERDQLHRGLQDDEARYRALVHHAYDIVVVLDPDGTVRYASPATERLLGPVVSSGSPAGLLSLLHPGDSEGLRRAMSERGGHPGDVTLRVRDPDGDWRTLAGHLTDRRDDPAIGAFVLNAHDRTRELRLTSGLREAQDMEALGVMAGGLAHDLNNILTVIGSHVDLLDMDAPLGAQGRADLAAIRTATDRATALTRGLLAISRRKQSARQPLHLGTLMRQRLEARRAPGAPTPPPVTTADAVRADPEALAQVIDAVLDASTPIPGDGEPDIRIEAATLDQGRATILGIEPGVYVVLRVGAALDEPADSLEDAITSTVDGEWNPAPSDLALLMALASVREVGGTLARERVRSAERLAVFLPRVA